MVVSGEVRDGRGGDLAENGGAADANNSGADSEDCA